MEASDFEIDMGTLAAHDVKSPPYVLNLEHLDFDPDGDRPNVEMSFTMAADPMVPATRWFPLRPAHGGQRA